MLTTMTMFLDDEAQANKTNDHEGLGGLNLNRLMLQATLDEPHGRITSNARGSRGVITVVVAAYFLTRCCCSILTRRSRSSVQAQKTMIITSTTIMCCADSAGPAIPVPSIQRPPWLLFGWHKRGLRSAGSVVALGEPDLLKFHRVVSRFGNCV